MLKRSNPAKRRAPGKRSGPLQPAPGQPRDPWAEQARGHAGSPGSQPTEQLWGNRGWHYLGLCPVIPNNCCRRRGYLRELLGPGEQVRGGRAAGPLQSRQDLNPSDGSGGRGRRLNFIYNTKKIYIESKTRIFLNQNILLLLNKPSLTQPHVRTAAPHASTGHSSVSFCAYRCQQPFHPGGKPRT